MRERVFTSLTNAADSGYDMHDDAQSIAVDIGTYDQQFEGMDPAPLVPIIEEWQRTHDSNPEWDRLLKREGFKA